MPKSKASVGFINDEVKPDSKETPPIESSAVRIGEDRNTNGPPPTPVITSITLAEIEKMPSYMGVVSHLKMLKAEAHKNEKTLSLIVSKKDYKGDSLSYAVKGSSSIHDYRWPASLCAPHVDHIIKAETKLRIWYPTRKK